MTQLAALDRHGALTEPATLTIQRLLPGPIEQVWAYLIDGDLRRQWFAAGAMDATLGAQVELVWRNDELTDPPGTRAEGPSGEHRMMVRVTEVDPPRHLAITWGESGVVSFDLEAQDDEVLLTLVHRRLPERPVRLSVASGWHAHLDILEAKMRGKRPEPFWDSVTRLKADYDHRLPAR
jgi:uncharacterized protein YndB with AHSA1/START domain